MEEKPISERIEDLKQKLNHNTDELDKILLLEKLNKMKSRMAKLEIVDILKKKKDLLEEQGEIYDELARIHNEAENMDQIEEIYMIKLKEQNRLKGLLTRSVTTEPPICIKPPNNTEQIAR